MTGNVNPQGTLAAKPSAAEQLERHLATLPKSRQRAHTALLILFLICGVASVGLMIWAIYASVRANSFGIEYVPFWWFIWAAVVCLALAFNGLSTVVAEADPPFAFGGSNEPIKFGRQARRSGWLLTIGCLVGTAAFAALAVYIGVTGVDLFEQFITGVVAIFAGLGLIAAFFSIVRRIVRSLRRGQ